MLPPTLRLPLGGKKVASAAALGLFAAVDHRHDDAPGAGIEHALEVLAGWFQGMRTMGALPPVVTAPNMSERVRMSMGLCSVSTTSQSKPRRDTNSAASGLGSESQVPTDGSPAAKRRLT